MKQHDNYIKLQSNRQIVLNDATKIAATPIITADPIEPLITFKKPLNSIDDLTDSIKKLDERKDNRLGIVWSEDPVNKTRIRDARGVKPENLLLKEDLGEKYAMQVLNQVRGGILLLENRPKSLAQEEAIAKLLLIAEKSLTEINELPKSILAYNNAMVDVLKTAGIPDAAEQLNFAKEIANFKDDHQHIVTLNTVKDNNGAAHTVIEADVMLNGLTDSQKAQYAAIAKSNKGVSISDVDGASMTWYNKLPDYQKALIHDVADDIAKGTKVIPAQLRELIGVRNGYEKTTAIISPDTNGDLKKPKVLVQSLHCGAPASKNKHGGEQITEENIKQLQSFAPSGSTLNLNNLTSETTAIPFIKKDGIRSENWISKQIAKAVTGIKKTAKEAGKLPKVTSSMSPINKWRVFGGGLDHKQFANCLKSIGTHINEIKGTDNIQNFLKRSTIETRINNLWNRSRGLKSTEDLAREELTKMDPRDPITALTTAIDARKNLNQINLLVDDQNKNLEVSGAMKSLEYEVKHGNGSLNNFYRTNAEVAAYPTTVDFCKSGKDRTGMVELKGSQIAISAELGLSEAASKEALKALGAGGHTQEMAGIQGGSVGNHSIKMSAEFGLNPADQVLEGVINQKSSGYNSEIKLGKTILGFKTSKKVKAEKQAEGIVSEVKLKVENKKTSVNEEAVLNAKIKKAAGEPLISPNTPTVNQQQSTSRGAG